MAQARRKGVSLAEPTNPKRVRPTSPKAQATLSPFAANLPGAMEFGREAGASEILSVGARSAARSEATRD